MSQIKTKVIHHDIIMKLVTTKLSEKSLKTVAMVTKILPLIPKLKIIIIPLKKQQKIRNTGSIKISK